MNIAVTVKLYSPRDCKEIEQTEEMTIMHDSVERAEQLAKNLGAQAYIHALELWEVSNGKKPQ